MQYGWIVLIMALSGHVQAIAATQPIAPTTLPSTPVVSPPTSSTTALVVVAPAKAPVAQTPADKAKLCASCHNIDGNSTVPAWPSLAGQSPKYLMEQMIALKAGAKGLRPEPVMEGILAPLSNEELSELAQYFANQKVVVGATPEAFVTLGEQIYRGGNLKTGVPACAACHDARGAGNALAGFPALSGQQPDYVIQQLKNFRTGLRKNDPNNIMQDIAARMSEEEIKAVANYVHGLH